VHKDNWYNTLTNKKIYSSKLSACWQRSPHYFRPWLMPPFSYTSGIIWLAWKINENKKLIYSNSSNVLIESTKTLDVDRNCHKATRLVPMESNYLKSAELQALPRVKRNGQKNSIVQTKRLTCKASSIEANILSKQEKRDQKIELIYAFNEREINVALSTAS